VKRRLSLKRETLTQLAADDLRDVVGAAVPPTSPVKYCLLDDSAVICTGDCWTRGTTCAC